MKRTSRGLITPRAYMQAYLQDGSGRLDIQWAPHYSEPGYEAKPQGVLFANWNNRTQYDKATNTFKTLDATPSRLQKIAEAAGYEIEWSDEWTTCDDCSGAVRTSADSYSWQRSYTEGQDGVSCHRCVKDDPTDYLERLEGDARKAESMNFPLAEYGYVKVNADSYENGLHPGQNDAPEVTAASLRKLGVTRFLFQLDDVGQFDVRYSVWVHADEIDLVRDAEVKSALPYDPGTEMAKALRGEPTEHYTVTTRQITPEEFVDGSWVRKPS